jgi:secreted PhoX family phosphatase
MARNDDGMVSNDSKNETFHQVVAARLSRRGFMSGGLATIAVASLGGVSTLLQAVPASAKGREPLEPLLGFAGIPVSSVDDVIVPPGYTARVLIAWGDPVSGGPAFRQDASNTAAEQAQQWGMHNDGLVFFDFDEYEYDNYGKRVRRGRRNFDTRHGLIVQNNEYTDDVLLFPDGTANWNQEKTNKALNAHGVSIIEISRQGGSHGKSPKKLGEWEVVRPSPYARRITGRTPMLMAGPLAQPGEPTADPRLITNADSTGRHVLGTLNNCAMGYTPWGTYLTCEENFNGYFRKNGTQTPLERRYGINAAGQGYLWHLTDVRFRADEEPNEAHRFGWVVEIDPFEPQSVPVKRTALGRMKHEGAWLQEARDGRVVVYMGDDEQFEYIYRYVSRLPWKVARAQRINPLDDGTLFVAKFHDNGTGDWLPLTPDNPKLAGWSLNDILLNTRGAADVAGATPMDRPEWIDTFPEALTAIATLTNNSARGVAGTNPRTGLPNSPIDAANPRVNNQYGHIIKWWYREDWTEPTFSWDIFTLAGDPASNAVLPDTRASSVIGDKFGSPDGIYVAPSGRLWIQTDVSGSTINSGAFYTGFGNNQMLCSNPFTGEIRRFLVGPNICEITGVMVTPDEKTMFVGIQHPGEARTGSNDPANPKQFSSWPDGPTGGRPRSACVIITKDDGGEIGS